MMQTAKFTLWTLIFYIIHLTLAKTTNGFLQSRIFGGIEATSTRYPYFTVVKALYFIGAERYTNYCGGTLIAENIVMTAAQCLDYSYPVIQVEFNSFSNSDDNIEVYNAVDWVLHENYVKEQRNVRNDIALIYLDENDLPKADPVELYFDGRPDEDDLVTIVGFGSTEHGDGFQFKELFLRLIKSRICRGLFGGMLNTNLQFCTDESGKAACRGDSGGPAVLQGNDPSFDIQVGIISFGSAECSTGSTVYSRVSGYETWIKQEVCIRERHPHWCNGTEMVDLR
mmetsp:Transcript_7882/g.12053  ORF Transcript_7882/g.12053 Transcript_7882/m.12053 type:complete len:283 (+) Transcript_7882:104-952(+)